MYLSFPQRLSHTHVVTFPGHRSRKAALSRTPSAVSDQAGVMPLTSSVRCSATCVICMSATSRLSGVCVTGGIVVVLPGCVCACVQDDNLSSCVLR